MTDTNHVRIERTFDAPIDVIWSMWTEPDHFAHWYGPMGATIPKAEMTHIGIPADSPGGQGWAMAIDKLVARVADHAR
jgi:hypothetical protein